MEGLQALRGADTSLPLELTVDSLGLHATIISVQEGKDYGLRPTTPSSREKLRCPVVPGLKNIADALTKRNPAMYRALNSICLSGAIDREVFTPSKRVLSATWSI